MTRELVLKRDFRCGISHAIYRKAIATLICYGAVSYGPLAYSERSPFYNERASTVCGDYGLDTANSLLDSAGLNERDDEGNRLWKGKPFEFTATIRIHGQRVRGRSRELGALRGHRPPGGLVLR